jgi:hypothetical protein
MQNISVSSVEIFVLIKLKKQQTECCCLLVLYTFTLKMESVVSSEISVYFHQATWDYILKKAQFSQSLLDYGRYIMLCDTDERTDEV